MRETEELLAAPPDRFVAEREALAGRLEAAHRESDAAEIRRLRRPSWPLWAVNRLARTRPQAVSALVAAVDLLARSQRRAASGMRDAGGFRSATAHERERLAEATDAAAALIAEHRPAPRDVGRERIRELLIAAARGPKTREALKRGALEEAPAWEDVALGGARPTRAHRPRAARRHH